MTVIHINASVANRRAAWRWGFLVVGLLSLQIALGVVAISLANSNPSRVIPDYYDKALQWDQTKATAKEVLQTSFIHDGETTKDLSPHGGPWNDAKDFVVRQGSRDFHGPFENTTTLSSQKPVVDR